MCVLCRHNVDIIILFVFPLLTAANILVDETAQRIKLTDFGSAEIIGEKRTDYTKSFSADPNAGTLSYNPPEVHYTPYFQGFIEG